MRSVVAKREREVAKTDEHEPDCPCYVKAIRVCLGPGRCSLLTGDCDWCMVIPNHVRSTEDVDLFLKLHAQGN